MCMNNPKPYSGKQPLNYKWGYKIVRIHVWENPITLYPVWGSNAHTIDS